MKLEGFEIFVNDMPTMIKFYRDVLEFGIKENEETKNVYLIKDGILFLLYGRKDFEFYRLLSYCCFYLNYIVKALKNHLYDDCECYSHVF